MKTALFPVFLLLLASCSGIQPIRLPELTDLDDGAGSRGRQLLHRCNESFVQGSWQFVHSIAFQTADGAGATVLGVTVLTGDTLKCVLMGVEGFVLFEAVLDQDLEVKRALPPFDNPEFAKGLMRDVQTLFLLPPALQSETGSVAGNGLICRYHLTGGEIADLIMDDMDHRQMNIYGADLKQRQSIVAGNRIPVADEMVPETLELTTFGLSGYTLTMKLISAEKI